LKTFFVYNVSQCKLTEKWERKLEELTAHKSNNPIGLCEEMVAKMPNAPIVKQNSKAFYVPSKDEVHVPEIGSFDSSEEYYSTLFHELVHSTAHESRLNRKKAVFEGYTQEELTAEIGSSFLCGLAGILPSVVTNNAAYIAGWLEKLKSDTRFVVIASNQAGKAADYICGTYAPQEKDAIE
jgi:antirestriction protein ArdC